MAGLASTHRKIAINQVRSVKIMAKVRYLHARHYGHVCNDVYEYRMDNNGNHDKSKKESYVAEAAKEGPAVACESEWGAT